MKAKIAAVVCRLLGIQPAAPLTDRQIEIRKRREINSKEYWNRRARETKAMREWFEDQCAIQNKTGR